MISSIGIIGLGKMGKIMSEIFSADLNVETYDIKNGNAGSLKKACQQNLVLICTPTANLKRVLSQIKKLVKEPTVVMDIASTKRTPTELMLKTLPKEIQVIGSHPLFGPNSLKSTRHIILCPVRINGRALRDVRTILKKKNVKAVIMSPEEHDRLMANTQFVVHLFAQLSKQFKINKHMFLPKSYKLMTKAFEVADTNDEFLKSIATREAGKTLQIISAKLKTLRNKLRSS